MIGVRGCVWRSQGEVSHHQRGGPVSRLRLPTAVSDHCCLPPFMYKMVMNSPSELVCFSFHEKTLKSFIGSSSFPAPWVIFYCFWKYYFPFNQLGHGEQSPRSITCSDTCQTLPGMYCIDDSQTLGGRHFIVLPSGQWKPPLLSRPTHILLNWSPLSAYLKVLWEPWHADFLLPSLLMKPSFLHFLYHSLRMGVFFRSLLSSFFLSLFSVLSPLCLHRLWVTHQPMFV